MARRPKRCFRHIAKESKTSQLWYNLRHHNLWFGTTYGHNKQRSEGINSRLL